MIHNRKVTAIVPIKEHSDRVENKNFRSFTGKPLYHHILETLEKTYAIDDVIVDTDSLRVKNEAGSLFAKVRIINRPDSLVGDFISVNSIIEYDISQVDGDIFVQTHATNPLLKAETIAAALKMFIDDEEHDSLFTVNRFQSRFYTADCKAINHNPDELLRTQDLSPVFEENSNLYVFTHESFAKTKQRIGKNPQLFEMSKIESIDIDDMFSFHLAEILSLYASDK